MNGEEHGTNYLEIFALSLIAEKGIELYDVRVLDQTVNEIIDKLMEYLNMRIIEQIPISKLQEFSILLDSSPTEKQIEHFYKLHIPDFHDAVRQALLDFKDIYLQDQLE